MTPDSKTILLVEDNASDVLLMQRAFAKARISNALAVAEDGQEALDYLYGTGAHAGRDIADLPAIIMLDLNLPKISGIEVLQRIRSDPRTHRVPVIILTSSNEEKDLCAGYDFGANSYICKPVDFGQFATAVAQVGLYWLILNEAPPRPSAMNGTGLPKGA